MLAAVVLLIIGLDIVDIEILNAAFTKIPTALRRSLKDLIQITWGIIQLFSIFAMPLLLGVLAYYRIVRYQRTIAHVVGFLIPPLMFFYLASLFWVYLPAKAHPHERCGMPAMAAMMMVWLGMFATIVASLVFQLELRQSELE